MAAIEDIKQKMNAIDFEKLYQKLKFAETDQKKWEAMKNMEIAEQRYLGYKDMLMRIENIKNIEVEYEKKISECR